MNKASKAGRLDSSTLARALGAPVLRVLALLAILEALRGLESPRKGRRGRMGRRSQGSRTLCSGPEVNISQQAGTVRAKGGRARGGGVKIEFRSSWPG